MAITQGVAAGGGPFYGVNPPPYQTSKYYWPHFLAPVSTSITLTANVLYRTWFYVAYATTFAGGWTYNNGAGDNGVVMRIGVWNSAGVLKKDFGVITLTAAAALRTAANSVTLAPGWYQIGLVSSGTPVMTCMDLTNYKTAAGAFTPQIMSSALGSFAAALSNGGNAANSFPLGDSASFTYGALPDPITTATATINGNNSSTTVGTFPWMGLYV